MSGIGAARRERGEKEHCGYGSANRFKLTDHEAPLQGGRGAAVCCASSSLADGNCFALGISKISARLYSSFSTAGRQNIGRAHRGK